MRDDTDDARKPDEAPSTTLDAIDYPDPNDLADEVLRRLRFYRSLIVSDPTFASFPDFLIYAWRGVYVVRGQGDRPLGAFASIEAAISCGRGATHDESKGISTPP